MKIETNVGAIKEIKPWKKKKLKKSNLLGIIEHRNSIEIHNSHERSVFRCKELVAHLDCEELVAHFCFMSYVTKVECFYYIWFQFFLCSFYALILIFGKLWSFNFFENILHNLTISIYTYFHSFSAFSLFMPTLSKI